jgi:hypothetical protein
MSLFTTTQIPILHDSPGPWIMHVPVVSTRHIPPGEAEARLDADGETFSDLPLFEW